ncbi:protein kinase domain-containing protein [Micromonospora sp. NBC_01638]|uniref:protein kinase domain-containing protein n=1 Tax=Micromonospora sp. NBC_01638 TaxID=2975982 RepID=UPI003868B5CD|nr:protein kinase [Micromonospora sp. NBC_01638]
MAQLTVLGDWVGPGEKLAAESLAADLPVDWEVIAGRKLPGDRRDDVDLLVVGEQLIFLLDEKHWGPTIVAGDAQWLVNGQPRRNPLDRASHLARVVAGLLQKKVTHWGVAARGQHRVHAGIILSKPDVHLLGAREHDSRELILPLPLAAEGLRRLDKAARSGFAPVRASALAVLKGLPQRDDRVVNIGPYTVDQELAPVGRARCFRAQLDQQVVLLRCYPLHGWGGDDPEHFIRREERAIRSLADLGRAWQSHPVIADEARQWLIVPVVPPPDARNLRVSVDQSDPARPDDRLPVEVARPVVRDAFQALTEVHGAKLLHRGLHPRRIWLGRQMRVCFSDFYLARISGEQSVALFVDYEDLGLPYRAPECKESLVLATPAADVYSLALSMAVWLIGEVHDAPDVPAVADALQEHGDLGAALADCLIAKPERRPTAAEVATRLIEPAEPARPAGDDFRPGATIKDRYGIERRLGQGAYATTWAVWDADRQRRLVLKQFHDEDVAARARQEYDAAERVRHANCARVYDIQMQPPPGFLVNDYIDGVSLRDKARQEPLQLDLTRRIASTVLQALDHIHGLDLVHGDISPGNIIITPDDSAVLIDFGLTGKIGNRSGGGTPFVMAPEVLQGAPATVQSDLYALAASLAMCMLGRPPYAGDAAEGPLRDSTPVLPTQSEKEQWGPDGAAFLEVLFQALDPDPVKRPASAVKLATQLDMAQASSAAPGEELINPTVDSLRRLYRGSTGGNSGNRGLDDDFAVDTYVRTRLDVELMPAILEGALRVVLLTGNPGDGKTAFLAKAGQELRERGATTLAVNDAGWRLERDGHTYVAVYDASESHEGTSSDSLIQQALDPDGRDPNKHTALIAANDGRLLQFFTDFEDLYEDLAGQVRAQIDEQAPASPEVTVVDLKQRALADLDSHGLATDIVDAFTAHTRWQVCASCISRKTCPMLQNATALQTHSQQAVGELVLISHLRRLRRATFRDVRSAIAWLITGDRTCQEVHEATRQNLDPSRDKSALLHDLAFDAASGDYLVREWADVDPALVASPEVERVARLDPELVPDSAAFDPRAAATALRRLYMATWTTPALDRRRARAYRYLDDFLYMLRHPEDDAALPRLLLGASRIVGAPRYDGTGLAIKEGDRGSGWAVLKEIPSDQFRLEVHGGTKSYVESIPDRLTLQHDAGSRLPLTLDTVELVLRAADGEVLNDVHSDAVRQDLDGFAAQLRRQSATVVRIVDPAGSASTAVLRGQHIYLEET